MSLMLASELEISDDKDELSFLVVFNQDCGELGGDLLCISRDLLLFFGGIVLLDGELMINDWLGLLV